jgi:hypothetical protein
MATLDSCTVPTLFRVVGEMVTKEVGMMVGVMVVIVTVRMGAGARTYGNFPGTSQSIVIYAMRL